MIVYTPARPAQHIPVVDLAAADRAAARAIHEVCRDTGFFYAANHGVSPALVAAQFEWAARFFALPLESKLALHMNNSPSFAGYEPIAAQTLDTDSPPDLKESFYCAQELPDDHPYVQARLRAYGGNQWPAALPGFREQMLAYYLAVRGLGERLMGLVALSLELPQDFFVPMYRYPAGNVRLIRYPPQPADARFNQLGAGAHTDWGGITLLAQDDIGGLEIENAAGEWIAAKPVPETFVINLGDMMARWTNGLYHSSLHRVLNNNAAGRDRYSIAYFYSPDHYAQVECLPTCQGSDNPPQFAPCTAGEHLREMFDLTYGRKAA